MHWGGGKFKLFAVENGFTGQIFTGELSKLYSAGALRQDVLRDPNQLIVLTLLLM